MTLDTPQLYAVMLELGERRRLDADYAVFMNSNVEDRIESVAHELAHALVLGDATMRTTEIETTLDADVCHPLIADAHELATLRVEIRALFALGFSVKPGALLAQSSFRVKKPRLAELTSNSTATLLEAVLVEQFVDIVKATWLSMQG